MEKLMIYLYKNKIDFKFESGHIILGSYDTGYYGIVETTIIYDDLKEEFSINYGNKGYPYVEYFKDVDDLINLIKSIV